MPELDGRSGPHVFVDDLDDPVLSAADHHHLARSLRVRDGDPLTVSDGAGRWFPALFGPSLSKTGDVVTVPAASPPLTVAFSLVKGERPEWVVQKLTEVGIDVIVPLTTDRSVVRWDEARSARHAERFRTIAREAAMQCRRVWLPEVAPLTDADQLTQRRGVVMAQPGGGPLTRDAVAVMIGPEGGWSDRELEMAVPTIGLGPHVLRTETAAVVSGSLMCALRAGLVTARAQSPPRVR